jgi:2-dehydropantoate 2-reductase
MQEVRRLAELLTRSGMETVAMNDSRGPQWAKLLFNAATNPVCALTGLTVGAVATHPPTRRLVRDLIDEGRAVAEALSITLDHDPDQLVDQEARHNADHKPSTLQDVIAQRPTEIATLNGGIVDAARGCGVPVPLHESIVALITGLERSWSM